MGMPENLQVDNEAAFFGSPTHLHGMGPLIRLCLRYGFNLWLIPRPNDDGTGSLRKFNDYCEQKFLDKMPMSSMQQLRQESLAFERRHNSTYRYSKLKAKTPHKALAAAETKLIYSSKSDAPKHPQEKTVEGR